MLARFTKMPGFCRLSIAGMALSLACSPFAKASGWQTQQQAPPNVHVPTGVASTLPPAGSVTYRLGDQTNIARAAEPGLQFAPRPDLPPLVNGDGMVRQASWQEPVGTAGQTSAQPIPTMLNGSAPLLPTNQVLEVARMQMGGGQPGALTPPGALAPPPAPGGRAGQLQQPPPRDENSMRTGGQPLRNPTAPMAGQLPGNAPAMPPSVSPAAQVARATGLVNTQSQGTQGPIAGNPAGSGGPSLTPGLRSTGAYAATQQPTGNPAAQATQDGLRQPTSPSGNSETPAISLMIPSLEIQAFGPASVGINKPVQYRIVARNRDTMTAQRISVMLNLPAWVQVQNVNTTAGRREKSDDPTASRVAWMIDQIPAGQSQSMIVDVIATQAETFDLAIDWAMQPVAATASVAVTEPRLEMNIAGPNEVQYGETAVYDVSVRNPGTGIAENVSVMLPEALGGERATLGDIAPGQERTFQVELLARAAGQLDLTTSAAATGNLQASSTRNIIVRRPQLATEIVGPPVKYAGTAATYEVVITNSGDATARDVVAAIALPAGVVYNSGIDGAEVSEGGLRWNIGTLDIGDSRRYQLNCTMNVDGQIGVEIAARGSGEIASVARCTTLVETVADIVLTVEDPTGPLPLNQKVDYTIRIRNRGTRIAEALDLVFMFSEGIEPSSANGLGNTIEPGKVTFSPIPSIDPGDEIAVTVSAQATQPGTHKFRAQLTGTKTEAHEVSEGTTQFYGEPSSRTAENAGGTGSEIR
jgi:uncharacterized repeat protein (TIGR01451 family)